MNVSFVTFGRIHREADGKKLTSNTASTRYRVLLPAAYLAGRDHLMQVMSTDERFWNDGQYRQIAGEVVVFAKSFDSRNEQLATALRQAGRRVYFDICDNHFDHPELGLHYRRMIALSDEIVASTPVMAEIVRATCSREAHVIGDPVEGPRGTPRLEPGQGPARLLWFGHPVNLDTLVAVIPDLLRTALERPLHLTVVTAPVPGLTEQLERWSRDPARFQASFVPWSKGEVEAQLATCDLVIIPSLDDDRKNVKSPNRLTETIWAGRLAIAYPIPSYQEFADYAQIAKDVTATLRMVLRDPSGYTTRIAAGQEYIASRYSLEAIGYSWEKLFLGTGRP